jgi:hypothetical protein
MSCVDDQISKADLSSILKTLTVTLRQLSQSLPLRYYLILLRELFRSCVLPIVDYAASAWFGPGRRGTLRLCHALEKVQRTGARAILRA